MIRKLYWTYAWLTLAATGLALFVSPAFGGTESSPYVTVVVQDPGGAEPTSTQTNIISYPIITDTTSVTGTKTETRTDYNTLTKTDVVTGSKTETRTETGTDTHTRTNTDDSVDIGVSKLYDIGSSALYSGAEKIAAGIILLSQSGANSGEAPSPKAKEAMQLIGSGNEDVAKGRASIRQGEAVEETAHRLGAVGGIPHSVSSPPLDLDHAPASTRESLGKMENEAEVSSSDLMNAVAKGDADAVFDLASSAKGVELSGGEIAASIPTYMISSPPAPSMPVPSNEKVKPLAKTVPVSVNQGAPGASAVKNVGERPTPSPRTPASEEAILPLAQDQFLATLADTSRKNLPFGNPSVSLFHRVRAQYMKRRL